MIDYSDPCSLGPLSCNVGCRPESDVESVSVFSGYSRRSMGTQQDGENTTDPIENLKQRVNQFRSNGWLQEQDYRRYRGLLSTAHPYNTSTVTDMLLKEMEKELDMIEKTKGTMLRKQTRFTPATPASSVGGAGGRMPVKKPFGLFQPSATKTPSLLAASKKGDNDQQGPAIVDPKVLSKEFSDGRLSELFVECCFYARLGFLQPPCCLQCTYSESMKGASANENCTRWTIWRRDANHVLHPSNLTHNVIAVRCFAARKLVSGKVVDGNKWDTKQKLLIPA